MDLLRFSFVGGMEQHNIGRVIFDAWVEHRDNQHGECGARSSAPMNAGVDPGAMPAKVSLSERAKVAAGFAKLVDDVHQ